MLPIRIQRHRAVRAENDARAPGCSKEPFRFRLDFFFRTRVKDFVIKIAKAADDRLAAKKALTLFKGHPFDNSSPVDSFCRIIRVPGQVIAVSRVAADVKDLVITYGVRRFKNGLFPRSKDGIIGFARYPLEILEAQIDARYARFLNDATGQFCKVTGNDIKAFFSLHPDFPSRRLQGTFPHHHRA